MNLRKKCLNGSRILVMGVSYKNDIDDTRESPAYDIIRLLVQKGVLVCWYDPFVDKLENDMERVEKCEFDKETLGKIDCTIIVTGHSNVDYKMLVDNCPLIFDSRNVLKNFKSDNIVRL